MGSTLGGLDEVWVSDARNEWIGGHWLVSWLVGWILWLIIK